MLTRDQILDGDLVWLLTLDYAGRVWRFATERVDVSSISAEGAETLAYSPGLTPLDDVVQALAAVSSTPQRRSQSVEVVWDDAGSADSVAELVQVGHDLAAGRGEVALWARGTRYEERIIVVEGLVREPEYGARGESIAFTIEDEPWDDVARLIDGAAATIDLWPDVHPDSIGAVYPMVFGQPGFFRDTDGNETRSAGSPAICVDQTSKSANTLLIAGHHVDAGSVYVVYNDGSTGGLVIDGPYNTTNTVDGNSHDVAWIDVSTAPAALRTAGEWWISWSEGAALPSRYHAGAGIKTIGELMRTIADMSAVKTSGGEWAAIEQLLPWPVGGYVEDPATSPLGYLQDALLPLVPVGLATGDEGGLVPVLWRYEASEGDAIDHVEVGPGISRVGRPRYERAPRDVVQQVSVRFAYSPFHREYKREIDLRPDPENDGEDATTNAQCIAADLRYRRPGEVLRSTTIDSAIIWSDTTAARVAHWRIRRDGYSPRLVDYDVGADRAWLQVGDVVTLTDSELDIDEVVCLVVERRISDIGRWRLTFQILDGLYSDGTYAPVGRHGGPTWVDLGN